MKQNAKSQFVIRGGGVHFILISAPERYGKMATVNSTILIQLQNATEKQMRDTENSRKTLRGAGLIIKPAKTARLIGIKRSRARDTNHTAVKKEGR